MPIVVFQHADNCRPGRLGATLRDHAFALDIRRPDRGDPFPVDLDDVEGVVSLGGPQHVGGKEAWLVREIEFLQRAHARSLPIVGVCLGHQLLGAALGAAVGPMETPEAGMGAVDLTAAGGQTDPILAGIAWRSLQFQAHADEVRDTPPGATLLATSAGCKVQAFKAGMRSYGFQYHFEADRPMIREILHDSIDELRKVNSAPEHAERQCAQHYEMFARLGDRLCVNIASFLIPKVATTVGV